MNLAQWSREYLEHSLEIDKNYKKLSVQLLDEGYVEIDSINDISQKIEWLENNKISYKIIRRVIEKDADNIGVYDVEVDQIFINEKDAALFKLVWG